LIGSFGTCVFLVGYIFYLYKKLMFKAPWIAPSRVTRLYSGLGDGMYKSDPKWEAGRISRAESGIVSMRTAVSVEGEASQTGGQTEEEIVGNAVGRTAYNHKYRNIMSSAESVDGAASQTGGVTTAGSGSGSGDGLLHGAASQTGGLTTAGSGSGSGDDLLAKVTKSASGGSKGASKEGMDVEGQAISENTSSVSWA
jgi:hypothetical protein